MKMYSIFVAQFSDLSAILLQEQQRNFKITLTVLKPMPFFAEKNLLRLNPNDSLPWQAQATTGGVSASLQCK